MVIHYSFLPCLPPVRITKAGNGEESSRLTEKRYGNRMERRLTGRRGGDEEGKRRPRHGTEG